MNCTKCGEPLGIPPDDEEDTLLLPKVYQVRVGSFDPHYMEDVFVPDEDVGYYHSKCLTVGSPDELLDYKPTD